jgi:SAM-dependent methyltransferase
MVNARNVRHRAKTGVERALHHTPAGPRMKYRAELQHWQDELAHLSDWFVTGHRDWWGIRPPHAEQKLETADVWSVNAIMTMHHLRPSYLEELQTTADAFAGERVLEVGCGPLAPVLQFEGCDRHALDPLNGRYVDAGWPLYGLDAKFVTAGAERMPYPDAWFDSVISVNALDHVDDFERSAAEIVRVLRPGGRLMFEVEYHEPTVTEPLKLDDRRVTAAFEGVDLLKAREIRSPELFANLAQRFDLSESVIPSLGSGEIYAAWHGVRR